MSIIGWTFFAIINILILFLLDYDPDKNNKFQGFILGVTGALSGSLFIYFLLQGMNKEFVLTFSLVMILEAFFMMTLLFTKSFSNLKA